MSGLFLFFSSCNQPITPEKHTPYVETIPLDSPLLLRRISLDIRGTLPTPEEQHIFLEAGEDAIIEEFFNHEGHTHMLIDIFNGWMKTRIDQFNLSYVDYHLDSQLEYTFVRDISEEPLRLVAHVAQNDLPWTDIVTANYTIASELMLDIWPLESLEENTNGWQKAQYTDGRPPGGIVMSNGLWWRYYTTPNNFSRSRAMMLSELFLCENYLHRPIRFQAPALLERDSLNAFIQSDPACIGCHSTLDPLAAALFGFWWYDLYDPAELSRYHSDREPLGAYYLDQQPAWFGTPIEAPADLGMFLAQDHRFTRCTVQKTAEHLLHRKLNTTDFDLITTLHEEFEASNWSFKTLLQTIIKSDEYRAGALKEDVDPSTAKAQTARLLSVSQLENLTKDIAQISWNQQGYNQFQNDVYGYRILLGGIDGQLVQERSKNPSLTHQLTIKRIAQAMAHHIVDKHWDGEPVPILLNHSLRDIDPQQPEFEALIQELHRHLYSTEASPERIALDRDMFASIAQQHSHKEAWESLLSILFRDPLFWSY